MPGFFDILPPSNVVGLLNGAESSKDPFGIICRLPDGKIKGMILNQDRTSIEGLVAGLN
jgi:hypothetical protein